MKIVWVHHRDPTGQVPGKSRNQNSKKNKNIK
jgi:hypothetical protein